MFVVAMICIIATPLPYWIAAIACTLVLVANIFAILKAKMAIDLVANVDFNSNAGGDWLYLYATVDSAAGLPIKALRASDDVINKV